jgi:predicted transposase YdaD
LEEFSIIFQVREWYEKISFWLRFYDKAGNLISLPEEAQEQRAIAQEQRANTERQARLDAIPQLLQMGLSVEQVAQVLSLTVEEVEAAR